MNPEKSLYCRVLRKQSTYNEENQTESTGRAYRILKRNCHITVVLDER